MPWDGSHTVLAIYSRTRSAAPVYHLGLFREKVSLQPVECAYLRYCGVAPNAEAGFADYSKLPSVTPVDAVFLLDPLVATGGTACAALSMLLDWGIPGE